MTARILYRGTKEYLRAELTSTDPLSGVVEFSYDRTTWTAAEWEGVTATTTRVARLLLDLTVPTNPPTVSGNLYVRLTDTPEKPVTDVGQFVIL